MVPGTYRTLSFGSLDPQGLLSNEVGETPELTVSRMVEAAIEDSKP